MFFRRALAAHVKPLGFPARLLFGFAGFGLGLALFREAEDLFPQFKLAKLRSETFTVSRYGLIDQLPIYWADGPRRESRRCTIWRSQTLP